MSLDLEKRCSKYHFASLFGVIYLFVTLCCCFFGPFKPRWNESNDQWGIILHVPLSDVSPANAMDSIMIQGRVIRRKFPMLGSGMRWGLDFNNEPHFPETNPWCSSHATDFPGPDNPSNIHAYKIRETVNLWSSRRPWFINRYMRQR